MTDKNELSYDWNVFLARTQAAGELIRAGFDPVEVLRAVGLPSIKHLGLPPVTVQPQRLRTEGSSS